MAAFTDRNKDHYFETELSNVQTNVSQLRFHRTSLGVSTEIVELIYTEFEIPQNSLKYLSVQEELQVVCQTFGHECSICAKSIQPTLNVNFILTLDVRFFVLFK
jgi:hypothetical protein